MGSGKKVIRTRRTSATSKRGKRSGNAAQALDRGDFNVCTHNPRGAVCIVANSALLSIGVTIEMPPDSVTISVIASYVVRGHVHRRPKSSSRGTTRNTRLVQVGAVEVYVPRLRFG